MASTGSVSAWEEALLTAMVQYPVPVIKGPEDIQTQVDQICKCLASTKAGYPDLDLIVFPEYSTQGLNTQIWTYDEMLLRIRVTQQSGHPPHAECFGTAALQLKAKF